jgi:alkylation response protein AidB-like acyl-CoA dehydrogenase
MGWKNQPTTMVMFEDCRVPQENLVGTQGHGFRYALKALNGGRINIGNALKNKFQQ